MIVNCNEASFAAKLNASKAICEVNCLHSSVAYSNAKPFGAHLRGALAEDPCINTTYEQMHVSCCTLAALSSLHSLHRARAGLPRFLFSAAQAC